MTAAPAIVILFFYGMNLPADLATRKIRRVYIDIGGIRFECVRHCVEVAGRYILPR